jgi:hypothetical protein
MEKSDLRNEFLINFNEEIGGRPLQEFEISKNINYVEWLEKKFLHEKDSTSGLICTNKEIKTIANKITNDLNDKFELKSVNAFDIQQYLITYLNSITFRL